MRDDQSPWRPAFFCKSTGCCGGRTKEKPAREGGQKAAGGGKEEFTDSLTMTGQVRVRKYSHFVFALYIRIYR